jgi:MSHA biogenesis protein MshG
MKAERMQSWGWIAIRFAYLLALLLTLETSLNFFSWSIAPRFTALIKDFGVEPPRLTQLAADAGEYLFHDHAVLTLPLMAMQAIVLLLIPVTVFNVFEWNIPFLDALFRRRHANLVLRGLALAVSGQRPISSGLAVMASTYPSKWVRQRLRLVHRDVQGGENWVRALYRRDLIRPTDAAVLASAERVGNLEWALRETAAAGERRLGYRLYYWLQVLYPIVLLALGAVVFTIALGYFLPLITIIETLL